MPMTYMQLAHELAGQGYTREEFAAVLKQLTGQDYYSADPSAYIEGDFAVGMDQGTTPQQSGPPMESAGQRTVTAEPLPMMSEPEPPMEFELPAVMQMQQEERRLKQEQWRAAQAAAEVPSPSPESLTFPAANVDPTTGQPLPTMSDAEIARYPSDVQPFLRERYGYHTVEPTFRPMTAEEMAAATGSPVEGFQYPEGSGRHVAAAMDALAEDPETVYREEAEVGEPSESAVADYLSDKRLIAGELMDEPEPLPSAVADYLSTKRLTTAAASGRRRLEDRRPADYRGQDYVMRLDRPPPASVTAPIEERRRKSELADEFYEKAERPEGEPGGYLKASMDPFDFAGMVMDNRSLEVWSEAMWERFIQLFEVPVEKAVEGDLRFQRLLRPEAWDSDEDFQLGGVSQFVTGKDTGEGNVLTAGDRRNLERLWDIQDAEVMQAIDESLADAEARAALYPLLTNARKSVGNLANGLWDMGVSLVGGNIPVAVWKEKDPEERKRLLEEQAHEAIDEMFGKGMATFVITVLANPTAAVEVYPAEVGFTVYRPMKALARPAGRKFVQSMDRFLEWQGARGPIRAAGATAIKRGASATERALADPAAHYTRGGEEFLQRSGREALLAEEAIKEGMDVVTRSVSDETAAGRPPEVIETPLRPRYEGGGPVRPVADIPSPDHPTTFTARATPGEQLIKPTDTAAKLKEWRDYEAALAAAPEGTLLHTTSRAGGPMSRVEVLGKGQMPAPTRSAGRADSRGMTLDEVRAEVRKLEQMYETPHPRGEAPPAADPTRVRGRQMDALWEMRDRPGMKATPTGSGSRVSFEVGVKGGMRAASSKRSVSAEALESGVLDSVTGLSETRWPHTPKRQLGYEFEVHSVPVSAQTGGALGSSRKVGTAKRDPKPTILPDEAMGMIRDLKEIFGEEGAILRGIVSEEGLAQQVIAAVDMELANQFASRTGRATVVEAVVETANQSFWGGNMPTKIKREMSKTVSETLKDAAGRRRGEGGTSSVFNPLFELEGPGGRTVTVNGLRALARQQKADPAFRAKIQKEALEYVSRRIGAQAKARGVQDGVMDAIVRDSQVVSATEYAASIAADRVTMRAAALKGTKAVQKHTSLKNKLAREKAKPAKERDSALVDNLTEQLKEMEGTTANPGVVDAYLDGLIDKYTRTGERPSTWLFGDALEHAWNRRVQKSPDSVKGLWMLREHLRPRNSTKVFGSGLTSDQALMSTYFGFTKPSAQAQAAFRRAAAKPFTDITTVMPDRWMSKPLYKVSELMARDAGVLPAMGWLKGVEKYWRAVKLGKVAGNPGSHVMALGSNTLVQMQRRGDMLIASKAAGSLVDYMRFKAGMKTLVDPQIYRSLEHSGRVSGAMIKGEIDANMRRWLEDPEFATRDWAGDFMTAGIGRRVYDWWDTMFKIEDGVNQWSRRMKDWESLPDGTARNPIDYHFPISRTKTVEAQKINGKMVVDGRVLTDAQFRHMMGRAAMEPGSRFLVDFKDVPLLSIFKRNFPLLDMMMSDFSTWRMVTDTLPFLKEGIFGEIMMGATPRGYTSHVPLRLKRAAELASTNMLRTMTTAALSQRVSGEDHQMMRAMLNKYGAASPVFSFSATADPRVFSVSNGTSFSTYESVERWLRTAEAMAYTAPSRGFYGNTVQEWIGFVKPDAVVELPGSKPGEEPDTEFMLMLSDDEMAKLPPAQRRHMKASKAYWVDNAKTGGMGRKASMGLFYLEGNLYINMFLDFLFETRKEAEMGPKLSVADTMIRSMAPRWAASAIYFGLEGKREGDLKKYNEAMEALQKEEARIEAIPEDQRTQKDKNALKRILDPRRRHELRKKYLSFSRDVEALTREEYRAEAILGALDPSLAEGPLRRLAQRTLHAPVFVAAWHRFNTDPDSKRKVKDRKGMKAVGFQFKGTAIEGLIDRATRQFGRGAADAEAIHRTATRAGDRPVSEGSEAHEYGYEVGEKIKGLEDLYREILLEEAEKMQGRWDEMFLKLDLKAQQKGQEDVPWDLGAASIPVDPSSPPREIPLEGWKTDPRDMRKRYEKREHYYDPPF